MKFEFGDLYKFIVSAGLALATVAVLLLWLLMKEPFDLQLKEADIRLLSVTAQETIRHRQAVVGTLICIVPWGAPFAVLVGIGLSGWGLWQWSRLQGISDELAELDLQIKRAAVRPKTDDETAVEVSGVEGIEGDSLHVTQAPSRHRSSTAERLFVDRLSSLLTNYTVQRDMMVGGVGVDAILKGGSLVDKDYLVDFRTIRQGFNAGWLKQAALTLQSAALVYQLAEGRTPNTCLVVAVDDEVWDKRDYDSMSAAVAEGLPHRAAKHRIAVMKLSDLLKLDAETARTRLGLPVR